MKINISKLNPNPEAIRETISEKSIDELAVSMKNMGQLTPILVTVNPERSDEYDIVDGDHRLLAARKADIPELEVTVIKEDPNNNSDRFVKSLIVNIQREDLTFREKANTFKKLTDRGFTQLQIYNMTGCSHNMITTLMFYSRLEPEIQVLLDEGKLNPNTKMLSLLNALPTGAERISICNYAAAQGLSGPSTISLIQVIKLSYKLEDEVREFFVANVLPYDISVINLLLQLSNVQQRLHLIEKYTELRLDYVEIRRVSKAYLSFLDSCPEFIKMISDPAFTTDSELLTELSNLPLPDKRVFIMEKVIEYQLTKNQAIVLFSSVSMILDFEPQIQDYFWEELLPLNSMLIHLVSTMPHNLETRLEMLERYLGKDMSAERICKLLEPEIRKMWKAINDVSALSSLPVEKIEADPSAAVEKMLRRSMPESQEEEQPETENAQESEIEIEDRDEPDSKDYPVQRILTPYTYVDSFFARVMADTPEKAENAKSVFLNLAISAPGTGKVCKMIDKICSACECHDESIYANSTEICKACKLGLLMKNIVSAE